MDKDRAWILVINFVIILVNSVVKSSDKFECYGDICNSGQDTQFCSTTFRYCRSCADIIGSCGKPDQPKNCTSYCVEHLMEMKWKEKKDDKCFLIPSVTNGVMNVTNGTKVYDQGNVLEVLCNPGYRLEYIGEAYCGPFGEFQYQAPTCKAITCKAPPLVPNGNVDKPTKVYHVGDNASYECDSGYSPYGTTTLTCTMDGLWVASNDIVGPFCLQEKFNVWMYACIALFLLVVITFSWTCVQPIRRHKGKTITIMTTIINIFSKLGRQDYVNVNSKTDVETGQSSGEKTRKDDFSGNVKKEFKHLSISTESDQIENDQTDLNNKNTSGETAMFPDKVNKGVIPISISQNTCQIKSPTECTGETVVPKQPESTMAEDIESLLKEQHLNDN